jgi:hypothetical protein
MKDGKWIIATKYICFYIFKNYKWGKWGYIITKIVLLNAHIIKQNHFEASGKVNLIGRPWNMLEIFN